jgi:hypothetical protein
MTTTVYGTSAIKRERRTNAELAALDDALHEILTDEHPATVRGVFYRAVSYGLVPKDEARGYGTVQRRILAMRRAGRIPYDRIADGSRWRIKPTPWTSMDEMLDDAAASYRRALWHDQPVYVELWIEKDAVASVVNSVTDRWDVPLLVARGYPSETFLHSTAQQLKQTHKPCVIYQLGDHDPSGVGAWEHTQRKLREFAPDVDITFQRIAVTPDQIDEYQLLTRPTKRSDPRAKHWNGNSVEVDAIPPSALRQLVERHVLSHMDRDTYFSLRATEKAEREQLEALLYGLTDEVDE